MSTDRVSASTRLQLAVEVPADLGGRDLPYFPIYNDDTGQLDASIFFAVTPEIKIGVQAVNLTNEITRTLQQFTVDGLLGPRSYFMNDRRFVVHRPRQLLTATNGEFRAPSFGRGLFFWGG